MSIQIFPFDPSDNSENHRKENGYFCIPRQSNVQSYSLTIPLLEQVAKTAAKSQNVFLYLLKGIRRFVCRGFQNKLMKINRFSHYW